MKTIRPYIMTLAVLCTAILVIAAKLFVPFESGSRIVHSSSSTSTNTEFRNGQLNDFCLPSNSLYSVKIPTERCRTLNGGGFQYDALGSFYVQHSLFGLNVCRVISQPWAYAARGVEYYIYTLRKIII